MSSSMPIDKVYAHCQSIANDHYENFPTASLLLKKELRPAVAVIYTFARAADDFADEGDFTVAERLAMLDDWEHQLDLCLEDKSENPVFIALADVMRKFDLDVQLFRDLLAAFRMDVNYKGFKTLDELVFYGKYSADPVGRLMLALHNIDDAKALQASDAICTALQLTNFWQDFKVDIPKGRCYLADEWLTKLHVSRDDVLHGRVDIETLRPAIDDAIAETQKLFNHGYALLPYLPLRLRLQIAATLAGGTSILHATQALHNPLEERPTLNKLAWLKISLSIVSMALRPNVYANRGKV
ncbi:MAG TPA: squalene synthase HpnC [Ghiorsea sp.]|nr:squalene synthase HpnC [Ghiorsea sp.]